METEIFRIDHSNIDKRLIEKAGNIIASGGLVAFPTETVYGLGGDATDREASRRIYAAKGRPSDNPLIVHICDILQLEEVGEDIPDIAWELGRHFWPGPMTLIVKRGSKIPRETTGGQDTVAVRLPSDEIARALIRASRTYIAAPSANVSGRPSPTEASHVVRDLLGRIDCIIDGGPVDIGLESTIIDLTEEVPVILRPGAIGLSDVAGVAGEAVMDPGLSGDDKGLPPKAPGMRYRHYAPRGELVILRGKPEAVSAEIIRLSEEAAGKGLKVGIIASEEAANIYTAGEVRIMGARNNAGQLAHNLYRVLREFDDIGADVIYSEDFGGTESMYAAIANRLYKAAGGKIIEV